MQQSLAQGAQSVETPAATFEAVIHGTGGVSPSVVQDVKASAQWKGQDRSKDQYQDQRQRPPVMRRRGHEPQSQIQSAENQPTQYLTHGTTIAGMAGEAKS